MRKNLITGFSNIFLNMIPKHRQQKQKIDKLDYIRLKQDIAKK